MAVSWRYSGEKFTNGFGQSDPAAVRWQGGCRCLHAALPSLWRWMKRVLVPSTCHYVASCLPPLRPDWIFKYQKGRSEPQKSHPRSFFPPPPNTPTPCVVAAVLLRVRVRACARAASKSRSCEPTFSTQSLTSAVGLRTRLLENLSSSDTGRKKKFTNNSATYRIRWEPTLTLIRVQPSTEPESSEPQRWPDAWNPKSASSGWLTF